MNQDKDGKVLGIRDSATVNAISHFRTATSVEAKRMHDVEPVAAMPSVANKQASSNPVVEPPKQLCTDSLDAWCAGNGLNNEILFVLQEHGAETFSDLLGLSEDDKVELVERMDLKFLKKKKVLKALSVELMSLFENCLLDSISVDEYTERKKHANTPLQDKSIKEENVQTNEVKAPPNRPTFPPGVHIVPHKAIVLDRQKAMESNPTLLPGDFTSLASKVFMNPAGGDLKIVLFVGATGSGYVAALVRVHAFDPF